MIPPPNDRPGAGLPPLDPEKETELWRGFMGPAAEERKELDRKSRPIADDFRALILAKRAVDPRLELDYCRAIRDHEVDSPETLAIRAANIGDAKFIEYADAFDRILRKLGDKKTKEATEPQGTTRMADEIGDDDEESDWSKMNRLREELRIERAVGREAATEIERLRHREATLIGHVICREGPDAWRVGYGSLDDRSRFSSLRQAIATIQLEAGLEAEIEPVLALIDRYREEVSPEPTEDPDPDDAKVAADYERMRVRLKAAGDREVARFNEAVQRQVEAFGQLRSGTAPSPPRPDYESLLRASIAEHIRVAGQYERAGRIKDTRYLRGVANLLGAILQGQTPGTFLPARDDQ